MLLNLRAIHTPRTLDEAAALVRQSGVFPLYGGGAYLVRWGDSHIESAVTLTKLIHDGTNSADHPAWVGAAATLETLCGLDGNVRRLVKADTPNTLRHALTVGDVLMETRPESLVNALFLALRAEIVCYGEEPFTLEEWFAKPMIWRGRRIILRVTLSGYRTGVTAISLEKVGRTPADIPIVAAVTAQTGAEKVTVISGVDAHPVVYTPALTSRLSDYRGSAEYRTAMAHELAGRG